MSKARQWMPLYIGDFTADTEHLSATETGIYIRLIMHCWQHGGVIPRDRHKLALISHCDSRIWHQYERTILPFFDVVDASTMQHRRVITELRRSGEISNKRKEAALQKHMQMQKFTSANASVLHTQSQRKNKSLLGESQSAAKTDTPIAVSDELAAVVKRKSRVPS